MSTPLVNFAEFPTLIAGLQRGDTIIVRCECTVVVSIAVHNMKDTDFYVKNEICACWCMRE